jgi:hypothetical protein
LLRTFIKFSPLIHSNKKKTHGTQPAEDNRATRRRHAVEKIRTVEKEKRTPAVITIDRKDKKTAREQ